MEFEKNSNITAFELNLFIYEHQKNELQYVQHSIEIMCKKLEQITITLE